MLIPVSRSAKPLPARQGKVCAYTTFTQREAHNPVHIVIEIILGAAERKREKREGGERGEGEDKTHANVHVLSTSSSDRFSRAPSAFYDLSAATVPHDCVAAGLLKKLVCYSPGHRAFAFGS